ncbi:M4 family metallopeptidase [Ideonella alba]|uniref:Neutral metalloproteinase n=1 Tax=Ideonella alba TaxID=2824118 RepID=A0A940YIT0_9BURK|nr:M4 family metallopeptidase [Ideonella alba]MBQ0933335.1 M4 family metallopeptidase [Ideonella alba]
MQTKILTHALALALTALAVAPALAATDTAQARAEAHLARFAAQTFHGPDHRYSVRDVVIDADGTEHVRLDRQYKGLRVIGGDVVVHSHGSGSFLGVSQTLQRGIDVSATPVYGSAAAQAVAQGRVAGDARGSAPELVVYARGDRARLAWDTRVFGTRPDGTPIEAHVIVSARTGKVLDSWDDVHDAAAAGTGNSFFSGSVPLTTDLVSGTYSLRDPSRGNMYTLNMKNRTSGGSIFTDADNTWGNGTTGDTATIGVDAQYGTAVTWDYYKNVHGRNGIANNGVGAYNRVHYSRKYNNAFWSDSCFCMTYGDGDGTTFNPFDSLDVAGHEMTHGVTSRTANLTYSGESGGLNEATSDIFGTLVEFYANNASDAGDYLIGEKLYKAGGGKALRYMHSPNSDGASADCWYSTLGSLDVHYSSGVANHFFYLLAEGSAPASGPASPTCVAGNTKKATGNASLSGIGRDKAGAIWYRALTVYMTSSTNYAGARTASLNAATDLYGAGSAEWNAVAAAWSAVLVN